MRLDRQQIDSFSEDGFLLADGFLDQAEIQHLRVCYMETLERLKQDRA